MPLSFLDFPDRPKSFLLLLSRSLSLTIFLVRFTEGRPDETVAEPEVTDIEERHLLLVLVEEDEEDSD